MIAKREGITKEQVIEHFEKVRGQFVTSESSLEDQEETARDNRDSDDMEV